MLSVQVDDGTTSMTLPYSKFQSLDITIGPVYFRINGIQFNPLKVELSFLGKKSVLMYDYSHINTDQLRDKIDHTSSLFQNLQMDPDYDDSYGGWTFNQSKQNAW